MSDSNQAGQLGSPSRWCSCCPGGLPALQGFTMSTINFAQPTLRLSPCWRRVWITRGMDLVMLLRRTSPRPLQASSAHCDACIAHTLSTSWSQYDTISLGRCRLRLRQLRPRSARPLRSPRPDFFGWRATRLECLLVFTWQPLLHYREGYDFYASEPSSLCTLNVSAAPPTLSLPLRSLPLEHLLSVYTTLFLSLAQRLFPVRTSLPSPSTDSSRSLRAGCDYSLQLEDTQGPAVTQKALPHVPPRIPLLSSTADTYLTDLSTSIA